MLKTRINALKGYLWAQQPTNYTDRVTLNISHLICILLLQPNNPLVFLRDILDKVSLR